MWKKEEEVESELLLQFEVEVNLIMPRKDNANKRLLVKEALNLVYFRFLL